MRWRPHYWKRIRPTEQPPHIGYTYEQCIWCGKLRKRKPCWVKTPLGHTDGWWQSLSDDGVTWTEPERTV
jgi:hypothetical protein